MRTVTVAILLTAFAASGCLDDNPEAQDSGADGDCAASADNATVAASCSASSSTTTGPAGSTGTSSGASTSRPTSSSSTTTTAPSSNSTGTGNEAVGGNETVEGNETAGNETAQPPTQEYTCDVDAGTAGFTFQSPAGNFGACSMTQTSQTTLLVEADPAAGCVITFDDNPDDQFGGSDASAGSEYPANGVYGMQCDLPDGATGGTGRIAIQVLG